MFDKMNQLGSGIRSKFSAAMAFKVWILALLVLVAVLPAAAQSDISSQVEGFFTEVETVLRAVAGVCAVIGLLGLAILNLGSVFPFVAEFKAENPKAARNIMTGLIILFLVGSGAFAMFLGDLS